VVAVGAVGARLVPVAVAKAWVDWPVCCGVVVAGDVKETGVGVEALLAAGAAVPEQPAAVTARAAATAASKKALRQLGHVRGRRLLIRPALG